VPARRRGIKILLGLVLVLAILAVIADRVGAAVAQNAAESRLAEDAHFAGKPSLTVHGVPFLTQAVRGKYRNISVSGRLTQLGEINDASLDVDLYGARLPLGDVIRRDIQQIPVDRVQGFVTVPYSELARLSQIPDLVIKPNGSKLDASATVTLPAVGNHITVRGEGELTLVGGKIRVGLTHLSAGSLSVPAAALPAVSDAVTAFIPVPSLPYGLHLDSIQAQPDGLRVSSSATNVVLKRLP
jgi:hypothetical protein